MTVVADGTTQAQANPRSSLPVAGNGPARGGRAGEEKSGFDLQELLRTEFPEPRWLVPGFVPLGVTLLAGRPKAGKTWLALDMAVTMVCGGESFNCVPVQQSEVLYLALEEHGRRLRSRLEKLLVGVDSKPVNIRLETEWPRHDEGGLLQLEAWLADHPAVRLVVVDSLAKFRSSQPRKGGKFAADSDALEALKGVADRCNVAIVVLFHTAKPSHDETLIESSGTLGSICAGTTLVLKRKRGSFEGTLSFTGREVDDRELVLGFDEERGQLFRVADGTDVRQSSERRDILWVLVEADDGLRPCEIAEVLGKRGGTVRRLLWAMRRDEQLRVDSSGKYHLLPMEDPDPEPLAPPRRRVATAPAPVAPPPRHAVSACSPAASAESYAVPARQSVASAGGYVVSAPRPLPAAGPNASSEPTARIFIPRRDADGGTVATRLAWEEIRKDEGGRRKDENCGNAGNSGNSGNVGNSGNGGNGGVDDYVVINLTAGQIAEVKAIKDDIENYMISRAEVMFFVRDWHASFDEPCTDARFKQYWDVWSTTRTFDHDGEVDAPP